MIPLKLALEDHPRVAIALAGEEKARFIITVLGEIESEHELKGHVPGRQRQGGWSAFRYQRDRERHVHENLVDVVRELKDLQKRQPCEWLVIAGADDVTTAVVKLLPRTLSKRLAGTFREEQFETSAEVVRRGALVAEEAERAEELQLSEQIRDMALARGNAVLGWDETFRALAEGRVHQLAVSANEVGSRDVDGAVQMALDTAARVEVVHDAAGEVLVPYRGIGALLRY